MKYLLTFLLSTQLVLACPEVQTVQKGDEAPCSGVFFNKEKELEIRKKQEKLERDLSLTELQVQNREEKSEMWAKEAERQAKARMEMENDLKKGIIYGAVGAVLVFVVNSMVIKATK